MKLGIKKLDIIIVAAVLCLAALSLLCLNYAFDSGDIATVEVNGEIVAELSLNENTQYDVVQNSKITNTVVVDGGYVCIINADCPDKICEKHKKISRSGESIVCLPNKVIVTINKSGDNQIDGVAK